MLGDHRSVFHWLILLVLLACGCGDGGSQKRLDMGGADGDLISLLIEDVNETAGDLKKMTSLFVKGSKPADLKKLDSQSFSIVGRPSVSGTSATAKVRVDRAGKMLGEVDWTFEKDGDKWKVKAAPMP
jgi:hypothetical protein